MRHWREIEQKKKIKTKRRQQAIIHTNDRTNDDATAVNMYV